MVLIRLDGLESPYLEPDTPSLEVVLGRAKTRDIAAIIIDGEVLLQDGAHRRVNKEDVGRELREQLSRPLDGGTLETRRMAARLSPYVEEFYRSRSTENGAPLVGTPHYVFNSRT